MRFYNEQRQFYCGNDLPARTMYLCILDPAGNIVLHKSIKSRPQALLRAIEPYREGLVIGCECTFTWYWLGHIYNTHLPYNVATPTRRIRYAGNRERLNEPPTT
jgi:hypothetical protein